MNELAGRFRVGFAAVALLVALAPGTAQASTATIRRALQNIVLSPVDVVLTPYVAGRSVWRGMNEQGDSEGVRLVYPIPGFVWQTGVQGGASVLRMVAGLLEFVPGVFLMPFETDLNPLYDLAEDREAVVDWDAQVFKVRAGVDYVSPGGA